MTMLWGRIVRLAGGDVDNCASIPLCDHLLGRRLRAEEHTTQIRIDNFISLL
jgi:hypothetical protein